MHIITNYTFPTVLFFLLLTGIFVFEGLGITGGRELAMSLLLCAPALIFLSYRVRHSSIAIPRSACVIFALFIISVFVSAFFSLNPIRSLYHPFFYAAVFLLFIFSYARKEEIKKYLPLWVFIISAIFISASAFINTSISAGNFSLVPEFGYQFVFSRFGSHNHLGDFLIMPILMILYAVTEGKKFNRFIFFGSLIIVVFYIFSYSRSAYLSLMVAGVLLMLMRKNEFLKHVNKRVMSIFGSLLLVSLLFFIGTIRESSEVPLVTNVHALLSAEFNLSDKTLTGKREHFAYDAIGAAINRPVFGVGPNNYRYVSGAYSGLEDVTTYSSHNIFLDTLAEIGVVGFLLFLSFFIRVLASTDHNTVGFYLVLALLVNFQTDYTFRIYSLYVLLFVILASIYREKNELTLKLSVTTLIAASGVLFLAGQVFLFGELLFVQ